MKIKVNGDLIDVNLIIFDSNSLQAWDKEDGKMILNLLADNIEKIIVVTKE